MKIIAGAIFLLGCAAFAAAAETAPREERVITMAEFLRTGAQKDTEFEEILITELTLRHQKDLRLPARDIVLDVKEEYSTELSGGGDTGLQTTIGLSKLFPLTGTEISAAYGITPSATTNDSSGISFTLTQPIAENAFGRSTRLLSKIIGLETEVFRHQIVEAYEDYLAFIRKLYLEWYKAYEDIKIGHSSYQENLKLLDNMSKRKKSKIANPIDINKIKLQVIARKERVISLEETYENRLNMVRRVLRHDGPDILVPSAPKPPAEPKGTFNERYLRFREHSRTYKILRMLERKSALEVEKEANGLLPSIDLLVEFGREGENAGIENSNDKIMAGISLKWPFSDQKQKAEHKISQINELKTKLNADNTHHRLHTEIRNLYLSLEREFQLKKTAEEKIRLAESILKDEAENYTYGKASLNDYISAVNTLDNNKFNHIRHDVLWQKLHVEWLRITDQLVTAGDIRSPI